MAVSAQDTTLRAIVKMIDMEYLSELVRAYDGDRYCKSLNVQKMFIALLVGMLRGLKSLRDIECFTEDYQEALAEFGIGRIARSSLADCLQRTTPAIFKGLFEGLRAEYEKRLPDSSWKYFRLLLMDSTMIEVPLSQVDWAHYRTAKGAIKMHTVFCHRPQTEYPVQMVLTDGKTADVTVAEQHLEVDPDSIIVADRGYASRRLFESIARRHGTFVIRLPKSAHYHPLIPRTRTIAGDKPPLDEVVTLVRRRFGQPEPTHFRRIVLPPFEGHKEPIILMTNDFSRTAAQIGAIYRRRWRIELFFKHLKQHLHLSTLLGCSRTAVENQLYIALILALLLAYLQTLIQNAHELTPYTLFRHIRNRLFQNYSLLEALSCASPTSRPPPPTSHASQLTFSFL